MPSRIPTDSQAFQVSSQSPSSAVEDSCTAKVAENKTHSVIEEMTHPNSINLGAENILDENGNRVPNTAGLVTKKMLNDEHYKSVMAEIVVQQEICKVFVEMPKPITRTQHSFSIGSMVPNKADVQLVSEIGQPPLFIMKGLKADYYLFDEGPEGIALGQINGRVIHEKRVFMFDPGGSSWNCLGCDLSTSITTETHEFYVELWLGKVLLFVFYPGDSSWLDNGYDEFNKMGNAFKSSNVRQHHDQISVI